eukprot:1397367-Rhodomonas_salina.1
MLVMSRSGVSACRHHPPPTRHTWDAASAGLERSRLSLDSFCRVRTFIVQSKQDCCSEMEVAARERAHGDRTHAERARTHAHAERDSRRGARARGRARRTRRRRSG